MSSALAGTLAATAAALAALSVAVAVAVATAAAAACPQRDLMFAAYAPAEPPFDVDGLPYSGFELTNQQHHLDVSVDGTLRRYELMHRAATDSPGSAHRIPPAFTVVVRFAAPAGGNTASLSPVPALCSQAFDDTFAWEAGMRSRTLAFLYTRGSIVAGSGQTKLETAPWESRDITDQLYDGEPHTVTYTVRPAEVRINVDGLDRFSVVLTGGLGMGGDVFPPFARLMVGGCASRDSHTPYIVHSIFAYSLALTPDEVRLLVPPDDCVAQLAAAAQPRCSGISEDGRIIFNREGACGPRDACQNLGGIALMTWDCAAGHVCCVNTRQCRPDGGVSGYCYHKSSRACGEAKKGDSTVCSSSLARDYTCCQEVPAVTLEVGEFVTRRYMAPTPLPPPPPPPPGPTVGGGGGTTAVAAPTTRAPAVSPGPTPAGGGGGGAATTTSASGVQVVTIVQQPGGAPPTRTPSASSNTDTYVYAGVGAAGGICVSLSLALVVAAAHVRRRRERRHAHGVSGMRARGGSRRARTGSSARYGGGGELGMTLAGETDSGRRRRTSNAAAGAAANGNRSRGNTGNTPPLAHRNTVYDRIQIGGQALTGGVGGGSGGGGSSGGGASNAYEQVGDAFGGRGGGGCAASLAGAKYDAVGLAISGGSVSGDGAASVLYDEFLPTDAELRAGAVAPAQRRRQHSGSANGGSSSVLARDGSHGAANGGGGDGSRGGGGDVDDGSAAAGSPYARVEPLSLAGVGAKYDKVLPLQDSPVRYDSVVSPLGASPPTPPGSAERHSTRSSSRESRHSQRTRARTRSSAGSRSRTNSAVRNSATAALNASGGVV